MTCHLTGGGVPEKGGEDRACLACHAMPPAVELGEKARLDHARARAGNYGCRDCHSSFFPQGPPVERKACLACHATAGKTPGWPSSWDPRDLHKVHVLDSSLACKECHSRMDHHLPSPWLGSPTRGARSCTHTSGRKKDGGPRSFVRVDCLFCHTGKEGGKVRRERCGLCHEPPK